MTSSWISLTLRQVSQSWDREGKRLTRTSGDGGLKEDCADRTLSLIRLARMILMILTIMMMAKMVKMTTKVMIFIITTKMTQDLVVRHMRTLVALVKEV